MQVQKNNIWALRRPLDIDILLMLSEFFYLLPSTDEVVKKTPWETLTIL